MNEVAELELPTQEDVQTDLRSIFQGAIRVALELILEEEIREMAPSSPLAERRRSGGGRRFPTGTPGARHSSRRIFRARSWMARVPPTVRRPSRAPGRHWRVDWANRGRPKRRGASGRDPPSA